MKYIENLRQYINWVFFKIKDSKSKGYQLNKCHESFRRPLYFINY